jgi:hypothetical protein
MEDDDDDDDRPPGEVLTSDSPHNLAPSHDAPEHACLPNADSVAEFPSLRARSKCPVPDEDDDNSVNKNAEAEAKRQRIHLTVDFYPYYSTLDDEGDEIYWDHLSNGEFKSNMEELKFKDRERIAHRNVTLGRCKDLSFRACDKSKSYCRPLVKHPPVDDFRARRSVYQNSEFVSSEEEKSRPIELR